VERRLSMPEVAPVDAVRTLIEKVGAMDLDDLRDVHNERFPESPIPPKESSPSHDYSTVSAATATSSTPT
jgi:hypothetical protein